MDFNIFKTILLDGDGVLWHGNLPAPGLKRFFDTLARLGIVWGLLTNNATRSVTDLVEKFNGFEIKANPAAIFTSALATADYLRHRFPAGRAIYVVGEVGLQEAIRNAGYVVDTSLDPMLQAVAVVAGLDRQFSYDKLTKAMRLIRGGAAFIATNPDTTFPGPDGLMPGAWGIVAAIAAASETQPEVIGKPGAPLYEVALRTLGADVASTVMLGDRLETDILGAQRLGIRTILVLSGVSSREDIGTTGIKPDAIFDDIAAVTDLLEKLSISPAVAPSE